MDGSQESIVVNTLEEQCGCRKWLWCAHCHKEKKSFQRTYSVHHIRGLRVGFTARQLYFAERRTGFSIAALRVGVRRTKLMHTVRYIIVRTCAALYNQYVDS